MVLTLFINLTNKYTNYLLLKYFNQYKHYEGILKYAPTFLFTFYRVLVLIPLFAFYI